MLKTDITDAQASILERKPLTNIIQFHISIYYDYIGKQEGLFYQYCVFTEVCHQSTPESPIGCT